MAAATSRLTAVNGLGNGSVGPWLQCAPQCLECPASISVHSTGDRTVAPDFPALSRFRQSGARRVSRNFAGCAVATSSQRLRARSGRVQPRIGLGGHCACADTRCGHSGRNRCESGPASPHRRSRRRRIAVRSACRLRVQRRQALQIARIADIHRRWKGRARSRAHAACPRAGNRARCDWHCARARSRRSAHPSAVPRRRRWHCRGCRWESRTKPARHAARRITQAGGPVVAPSAAAAGRD